MSTPEPPDGRTDRPADAERPTEELPAESPPGTHGPGAPAGRAAPVGFGTPGGPGAAPSPRRFRRPSRRTWLLAAAGLVGVLVIGAIGFGIGRHAGYGPGYGRFAHYGGPGHAMERGGFVVMGRDGGLGGPDGGFGGPGMGPGGHPGMGPGGDFGMGPRGDFGPGRAHERHGGLANTATLTGSVVSVAPDNLVVAPDGGAPQVTVPTNNRTRVRGVGNGLTGLQPGQRVVVRIGGDKSAVAVFSPEARAIGTITALNGDRAVLVRPDGLTENVDLASVNPKPANGDLVAVTGAAAENGATLKVNNLRVLPKAS